MAANNRSEIEQEPRWIKKNDKNGYSRKKKEEKKEPLQ